MQHTGLSEERWRRFTPDQRILNIASEMNRARKLLRDRQVDALRCSYERILRLADLSVATAPRRAVRREMLRWRDLIAALYIAPEASPEAHDEALHCLLRFTPEASKQIPYLLPHHSG